jgi:hypothetical protein
MKKLTILILLCIVTKFVSAQKYALGMNYDNKKYALAPRLKSGNKAIVTTPFVSLKKFTPFPGNQGSCSSCVGWSTGYAALTTSWAMNNNITDRTAITNASKSAMFLYVQIAPDCGSGSLIEDAMKIASKTGDCLMNDFNPLSFDKANLETAKNKASGFKIKDYASIWEVGADAQTKVDNTRLSLENGKPVVVGVDVYTSMEYLNANNYLYHPDIYTEQLLGGHALCVIGYDDAAKQFEIINSWGTGFGNNGYFKVSYDDYAKVVKYGFNFTLDERKNPEVDPILVNGEFQLDHVTGYDSDNDKLASKEVQPVLNGNEYEITTGIKKDDLFRLFARNIKKDCYVYVFSIDPNKKAEVLFPFSKNPVFAAQYKLGATVVEVPRVYKGEEIEIPGQNKAIKFDVAGNDNIVILYAFNQITDIEKVVKDVNSATGATMMDKLKVALGDRLMPSSALTYTNGRMHVSGKSTSGDIVPLILRTTVAQ